MTNLRRGRHPNDEPAAMTHFLTCGIPLFDTPRPTFFRVSNMIRSFLCFTTLTAWSISVALAQVPTPSTLLLETQPGVDSRDQRRKDADSDIKVPNAPPQELNKPMTDVRVDVTRYEIQGVDIRDQAALDNKLAAFIGPQRSFEDLGNAARVVTAHLQREQGLYLAYAYLPAQDVQNGVIRIQAMPGVLDRVEVQWPEQLRVKREIVQAHLDQLKPGQVIRVDEVERVVFLLNDLRGIRVNFAVKPGSTPGTAVLVAAPVDDAAFSGSVSLDANGSRFSGSNRLGLNATWESPLGLGDALSVSHLRSHTGGLEFSLLGYTLPVGQDGLKLGVNASVVDYALDQNDFPLKLTGRAETVGVFGLYPLVRSRNLNLFALLGHDDKTFTDRQELAGSQTVKDAETWRLGLNGDLRDAVLGGGLSFFNLSAEQSRFNYAGGRPAGLDDDANTLRYQYALGRLQAIIPGQWMLWSHVRGQFTGDNLDSSEQCSLGGANAVRAFALGEASGDECLLFTLEARHVLNYDWLGAQGKNMSLNVFYDEGRTRPRHDAAARFAGFANLQELAGYGLAYTWDVAGEFTFNLSVAWELDGRRLSDPKRQVPRIFASYVHSF